MLVGYKEMPLFPGLSLSLVAVPTLPMNNGPNVPSSKGMLKPLNSSSRIPLLAVHHLSLFQTSFHIIFQLILHHTPRSHRYGVEIKGSVLGSEAYMHFTPEDLIYGYVTPEDIPC